MTQTYQSAVGLGPRGAPAIPAQLGCGETTIGSDQTGGGVSVEEFGYTSLTDWNALMTAKLRERYLKWEGQHLRYLQDTVLPLVSQTSHARDTDASRHAEGYRNADSTRHMDSSGHVYASRHADSSRHADGGSFRQEDEVCAAVALLRAIHTASNIPTHPVYLNMDSPSH